MDHDDEPEDTKTERDLDHHAEWCKDNPIERALEETVQTGKNTTEAEAALTAERFGRLAAELESERLRIALAVETKNANTYAHQRDAARAELERRRAEPDLERVAVAEAAKAAAHDAMRRAEQRELEALAELDEARAELTRLRAVRDAAARERDSHAAAVEWAVGEMRKVAESIGLDGSAKVSDVVTAARWFAHASRVWMSARDAAVRERDELRAAVETALTDGYALEHDADGRPVEGADRIVFGDDVEAMRAALAALEGT